MHDNVPSSPSRARSCVASRVAACAAFAAFTAFAALASPALAAPDLVIDSISVTPDSGRNGDRVTISITVRNQGNAAADPSTTRVRINQDPTTVGSGDDPLCSSIPTAGIAAGGSVTVGCTPTLQSVPVGANYIWAIADVNGESGETNKDNNRLSDLFTLLDTSPDLVIQSVALSPSSINNGQQISIVVTVKNQGTASSYASKTRVRINQDPSTVGPNDLQLCAINTAAIAVGGVATVECTSTLTGLPPGTSYVWAIADADNGAGQLVDDRANDRGSAPLQVSALAGDLVVDGVTVDPTSGGKGDQVTITATIRNQGTATAASSITRFRINQDPLNVSGTDIALCGSIPTPSLKVGASTEVQCKDTLPDLPPGDSYVWAIADATKVAGQSDFSNDRKPTPFTVDAPPSPDMAVTSVTVSPTSGGKNTKLSISAKVQNTGQLASPATMTRFVINQDPDGTADDDPVLCDQVSTVALNPGASVNVSCKPTLPQLPAGPSYIWAIADATGLSGDGAHDNDRMKVAFTVQGGPAPDLVVSVLTVTPTTAAQGATVAIHATITNQGTASALSSTARIQFNRDSTGVVPNDLVACDNLGTTLLPVGASTNVDCDWVVTPQVPGAAYLWATADVTDTAGQADRTNDSRKAPITIGNPSGPDLAVKRLVVRPNSARNGQAIIVKARVVNVGTEPAKASVTAFRISTDPDATTDGDDVLCGAKSTQALDPGAGVRVRCDATLADRPVGVNSIWAVVDANETSGQFNTANDARRVALAVTNADCTAPNVEPVLEWPVEQPRVIQDYASYGSVPLAGGRLGYHSGVDLVSQLPIAPDEVPVYAAADGEVVAMRRTCPSPADAAVNPPNGVCAAGWGNYVVIRHGAGIYTVYAHLGDVSAREGCVARGERIGLAGSSGSTTIPVHVHFDVMADLFEPVTRPEFGLEYYRKSHPLIGRSPETDTGRSTVHLDPRDYMTRDRVRLLSAATASRGTVTGGTPAFLAKGQQYVSYGELVPGFVCIDLPDPTRPQDGAPYADSARYGWVDATKVEVLESGLRPTSARVDGFSGFLVDGVGANPLVARDQATATSAEVTKAWGDQQLAPSGAQVTEAATGQKWQPVYVPGTTATGAGKPREAFVQADLLGPPHAH